jgi:COX assembly protein 1
MPIELPKKVEEGERPAPHLRFRRRLWLQDKMLPAEDQKCSHGAALFFRLKQKGFQECKQYSDAYAACMTGRTLSVVWACRQEMKELSTCMSTQ